MTPRRGCSLCGTPLGTGGVWMSHWRTAHPKEYRDLQARKSKAKAYRYAKAMHTRYMAQKGADA